MGGATRKKGSKAAQTGRKRAAKPRRNAPETTDERAAADAYARSLIAHGQAARPGPDGTLPPGATHEIVEDESGRIRLVRRRFSTA